MNLPCFRFVFALSLAMVICWSADASEIFVSLKGSDANNGSKKRPFATLERARDEIRKRKQSAKLPESFTVFVRRGVYSLPKGLQFKKQDSGSATAPIVWQAYRDEEVSLIGGRMIHRFTPYKGKILKANVASQGFQGVAFKQLIFDGQRQHLARYPNFDPQNPYGGGWAYADGKYIQMYQEIPGEDKHSFTYKQEDARKWQRPEEVRVFVFPRYNWWNNICQIKSVDPTTRKVILAKNASYAIRPGDRYYFCNAMEELDAPGEWYLDKESGTLYFWPPTQLKDQAVMAPTTRMILDIAPETSHLTFRGFTFECSEGHAIRLDQTTNCQIVACTIRNVGDYAGSAVVINRGTENRVVGCDIYNVGRHAVSLSGGDQATLTSANNSAENNYIHHTGVFYKQGVGVELSGVGNKAAHNLIHDCPRFGISFKGNNQIIEYNHIRHVNLETSDTGAIYTGGRDWLGSRGSVIRYNYFHDILGYGFEDGHWVSPHFAWGIYLDDNTGGVDVVGNIVARTVRGLIHLHNGRDNHIENNIFLDGTLQQIECNGWTGSHRRWHQHLETMIKGYESVAGLPAWKTMRNMDVHPNDAVLPDDTVMSGNSFLRNIVCYHGSDSRYIKLRNFSLKHNQFDYNLVWNYDRPILTGYTQAGRVLSGNFAPNPGFEEGEVGTLPQKWRWQIRPSKKSQAQMVLEKSTTGRRALRIDADFIKEKPRDNYPIIVSDKLELKLGRSYRISAKFKATRSDAKAKLMLQSYVAGEYFWANRSPDIAVGLKWKEASFVFKIPASGEKGWHKKMKTFRIRFDFPDEKGSLFVDDVSLVEIDTLSEWASWQAFGMDRHSQVTDPLFVDLENGDFRLKPESPAFKLGFQQIPFQQIGPQQNAPRATWPITEASGAREFPLQSEKD